MTRPFTIEREAILRLPTLAIPVAAATALALPVLLGALDSIAASERVVARVDAFLIAAGVEPPARLAQVAHRNAD